MNMRETIRNAFPALRYQGYAYLDNAATTHKPMTVIRRITDFYEKEYATIQRGLYDAGEMATDAYERVREQVAQFIGAAAHEIVFTSGTTESINFVATAWARAQLQEGDEIIISALEHHANIVPWQQVAAATGAVLRVIPLDATGTALDMAAYQSLLNTRTKLVALSAISNVFGTLLPLESMIAAAHAVGAYVLVDAAQWVPHYPVNVRALDCDFLAFSGHKMGGPTGIGVLYIKRAVQNKLVPYQFGGGMVREVNYHDAQWAPAPHCYEAGTPAIASVMGLGAAIQFMNRFDRAQLHAQEGQLCSFFIEELKRLDRIRILGPQSPSYERHLVTFVVDGIHAHDVAAYLNSKHVAVRAGHFCAQPLLKLLAVGAAVRMSVYCYTNEQDVVQCATAVRALCTL